MRRSFMTAIGVVLFGWWSPVNAGEVDDTILLAELIEKSSWVVAQFDGGIFVARKSHIEPQLTRLSEQMQKIKGKQVARSFPMECDRFLWFYSNDSDRDLGVIGFWEYDKLGGQIRVAAKSRMGDLFMKKQELDEFLRDVKPILRNVEHTYEALKSKNDRVINGAMCGLTMTPFASHRKKSIPLMKTHLASTNKEMRYLAAYYILRLDPADEEALRVRKEEKEEAEASDGNKRARRDLETPAIQFSSRGWMDTNTIERCARAQSSRRWRD